MTQGRQLVFKKMNKIFLLILLFIYSSIWAQKVLWFVSKWKLGFGFKVGENQKCYQIFGTNNLFKTAITDGNSSLGKSFF